LVGSSCRYRSSGGTAVARRAAPPYFLGAAPPSGDGRHRYVIVVRAIDVEHVGQLGVEATSTLAILGFSNYNGGHLLGGAALIPWAEVPAR
jgi:phosphatidylethanolamine-binding protein (PEBP) family uncharacterized protein